MRMSQEGRRTLTKPSHERSQAEIHHVSHRKLTLVNTYTDMGTNVMFVFYCLGRGLRSHRPRLICIDPEPKLSNQNAGYKCAGWQNIIRVCYCSWSVYFFYVYVDFSFSVCMSTIPVFSWSQRCNGQFDFWCHKTYVSC